MGSIFPSAITPVKKVIPVKRKTQQQIKLQVNFNFFSDQFFIRYNL